MRRRFVGHQLPDAEALVPRPFILPVTPQRIRRLFQVAVVGRDHASLGTVDEQGQAAGLGFDLFAQRADQVGAEDAGVRTEDFGVHRVIHQGGNRLAARSDGLDDTHAAIVEIGHIIVVSDFAASLAGRNLEPTPVRRFSIAAEIASAVLAHTCSMYFRSPVWPPWPSGKP